MTTPNIPTLLTLTRLIVSPLILPILFVYLLPFNNFLINSLLAGLFALLSLTDFFDGYLARKFQQETKVGRVLDPLADKFLTSSALIALLGAGKIYFYWVVLLIGRELFVMGLRHVALEHNFSVRVSTFGKIKTAVQMITILFIILNPYQSLGLHAWRWNLSELALILITLWMSLYSAKLYFNEFMRIFMHHEKGVQ